MAGFVLLLLAKAHIIKESENRLVSSESEYMSEWNDMSIRGLVALYKSN
jgi:hypothetical protein